MAGQEEFKYLYLIINDLLDIPILYLSSYINENKSNYYKYLNQVNRTDQWEDYIYICLKKPLKKLRIIRFIKYTG